MNLWNLTFSKPSVIRLKGESQNGGNKKTKQATYGYGSGGRKCSFFGKFSVLCNFVTSVLKLALVHYYRRNVAVTLLHRINNNSGYFSMSHTLFRLIFHFWFNGRLQIYHFLPFWSCLLSYKPKQYVILVYIYIYIYIYI